MRNLTITMEEDWATLLQRIANEETDGNKSAVIRELLLLKFDQHDIEPCSRCGKLLSPKEDDSYPAICAKCAKRGE